MSRCIFSGLFLLAIPFGACGGDGQTPMPDGAASDAPAIDRPPAEGQSPDGTGPADAAERAAEGPAMEGAGGEVPGPRPATAYELWVLDQADTAMDSGGTLVVLSDVDLAGSGGAPPFATVDFAKAAIGVGDGVGRRPHMIDFNHAQSHAVIANVVSGHVYVVRAADRKVVGSVRMTPGAGMAVQAHSAMPSHDDKLIVVANQNGKKLQRIAADFATDTFSLDAGADLDLAAAQDATHPDNAPICPVFTESGSHVIVTLRGGGAYLVDHTATPMKIVADVGNDKLGPNGCGAIATKDEIWMNAGGGTMGTPRGFSLYRVPGKDLPGTFAVERVYSKMGDVDAHGAALTRGGDHLWMADRFANVIEIFDLKAPTMIAATLNLASGPLAGKDPAPDLLAVSPDGLLLFAALRGPMPLTGNVMGVDNAKGDSPGVLVVEIAADGRGGTVKKHLPFVPAPGAAGTDPHAVRVRVLRP